MKNIKRIKKWIELLNNKYDKQFEITDINDIDHVEYESFKMIKTNIYEIIAFEKIETIDLDNYMAWYGGLNLPKLDAYLFNQLSEKVGYKIHQMSLKEKCGIVLKEHEYKLIVKYMCTK